MNTRQFLPWTGLSERERLVWSAVYASVAGDALAAAKAVRELRLLELDGETGMDPECEAARAGYQMGFEEFVPWYRVAQRIRHGHRRSYQVPTEDDIRSAYERFQHGRSDFY